MGGLHGCGAARGFGRGHVVEAVAAEEGPVDVVARPGLHLGEPVRVSGMVEHDAIEGEEIAHAFAAVVVLVGRGKGQDLHGAVIEGAAFRDRARAALAHRTFGGDDDRARFASYEFHLVVVAVAMRDEDEVGGFGVVAGGIGIDVDDEALGGPDLDGSAAEVAQLGPDRCLGRCDDETERDDGKTQALAQIHCSCLLPRHADDTSPDAALETPCRGLALQAASWFLYCGLRS